MRVDDRRLHPAISAQTDQVPQFGYLDDEVMQPVFDPDENPVRGGPGRVDQQGGLSLVEIAVQAQCRPGMKRRDQIPYLMEHETFRVKILNLRTGRPMFAQDAPDGRHMITVFAPGRSAANVREEQHDGGGNHAILNLGQPTRLITLPSPFHIRVQEFERLTLMMDLSEVERAVRFLSMQMEAGEAQHRMNQPLILRFHRHAQNNFLERVRHVVMDGQHLAQMVCEMVKKSPIDIGFHPGGDMARRSAQAMRNDRIWLRLSASAR